MTLLYILSGVALVLIIALVCVWIDGISHWLRRKRGVTELSSRQRRLQARRYKETTGRHVMKLKKHRRRRK